MEQILFLLVSLIFLILILILLCLKYQLNKEYWEHQRKLLDIMEQLDKEEQEKK